MKILIVLFVTIFIFSCAEPKEVGIAYSGESQFSRVCIDGVEYLYRRLGNIGYLSPHFKITGDLYLCD